MAHIAGIEIPKTKRLFIGLTYIYGIGRSRAIEICQKANIDFMKKVADLSLDEEKILRDIIQNEYIVEGTLRTQVAMNIKRQLSWPASQTRSSGAWAENTYQRPHT